MNEGYSFGILVQEEGIVIRPLVINALPSVKLDLSKDKIGKKVEQKFCNHTRRRRWMGDGSGMVQERQKDYFSMV